MDETKLFADLDIPKFRFGDKVYNTNNELPILGTVYGILPFRVYTNIVCGASAMPDDEINKVLDLLSNTFMYIVKFDKPTKYFSKETELEMQEIFADIANTEISDDVKDMIHEATKDVLYAVITEEELKHWDTIGENDE